MNIREMSCLAIAGGLALGLVSAPLAQNLDFESTPGKAHWSLRPAWSVAEGVGRKGSHALRWQNDNPRHYAFPHQSFEMEPGTAYRFGGWAKVVKQTSDKVTPQISVDWCDRNGKWLSADYAHAVVDNAVDTQGWTRFEGVTRIMPANVGKGKLLAILPKGQTGEVLFDDFTLEPTACVPIDYLQCSAYQHDFTSDAGPVRFVALLHLNTVKFPLSDFTAEFRYAGRDGKECALKLAKLTPEAADFTVDASAFAHGEQQVSLHVFRGGEDIGSAKCRIVCREKPLWRHIEIDKYGRVIFEGRPFFPLGMYTGRMSDEDLAVWKTSPLNFAMQYGRISVQDLDRWQSVNTYAATDVRSLIYGYDYSAKSKFQKPEESDVAVRQIIAQIGRHPALFAWYLVDEAPLALVPNIAAVNEMFHRYDPDHPTYAVTDKPDHPRSLLPCFDVLGMDPYPIGNHGNRADISICAGWALEAKEGIFGLRPQWHVPQTFNWGWYRKDEINFPNVYMPSRAEIANMTWQGIAAGANGLCSYSFSSMRKNLKGAEFDRAWADVCSVTREVKSREAILLSAGDELLKPQVEGNAVVVRAYRHDGKNLLLVVSRSAKPVTATIRLPRKAEVTKTLLGGGVTASADGLAVDFPALGYALIEIDLKRLARND